MKQTGRTRLTVHTTSPDVMRKNSRPSSPCLITYCPSSTTTSSIASASVCSWEPDRHCSTSTARSVLTRDRASGPSPGGSEAACYVMKWLLKVQNSVKRTLRTLQRWHMSSVCVQRAGHMCHSLAQMLHLSSVKAQQCDCNAPSTLSPRPSSAGKHPTCSAAL